MHTEANGGGNKHINWCLEILLNQPVTYWPLLSPMYLRAESAIGDTIHRNDQCKRGHMGL